MALTAGSIAFVGYNADGSDNIAFVALTDIAVGETIIFEDNEWNGTGWVDTNEGAFSWTSTSAVSAGTIVRIDNIGSGTITASTGTAMSPVSGRGSNRGIGGDNEVIYAYQGTAGAPTFITAVACDGFTAANGLLAGTGLTEGSNALNLGGRDADGDIFAWTGARNGYASWDAVRAAINATPTNTSTDWAAQDASGDQSIDGIAPDVPFSTTAFTITPPATISIDDVTVTEGDNGAQDITFTVTRSNNSGAFTVDYATANGTALAGSDYAALAGSVSFTLGGSLTSTFTIQVSGDRDLEASETFAVNLSNIVSTVGSATFADSQGQVTIVDNDAYSFITATSHAGQTLTGTIGADFIYGGNGNDTISAGAATDRVYAGAGDDIVRGGSQADILYGEDGNDTVDYSDAAGAVVVDLAGRVANETALTTGTVSGATATLSTDTLIDFENAIGSAFGDRLYGTSGDNVFQTGAGSDIVYGLAGNDTISYVAAAGAVFVDLSAGLAKETALTTGTVSGATAGISTDNLISLENARGSAFGDRLYGTSDANQIFGEGGDDFIYGIGGNDTIVGGAGDDGLVGGDGVDTLTGGEGADRFYFFGNEIGGPDAIADFVSGTDDIYLSLANFDGAAAFFAGTGTTDAIFGAHTAAGLAYDTANNVLYYDADGSAGVASAIAIASFTAPVGGVTSADIVFY